MPRAIFEWQGREYEPNPKSADWYWAIGIIAVAATIAAILFGNYLLVVLIIIAALVIALHGTKEPPIHRFIITDDGLVIGNDLHPYAHMHSFSVFEYIEGDKPPVLSIKTASWFSPHLMIPLENVDADALYEHLLQHVDEGEHEHSITDLVAAWLGF